MSSGIYLFCLMPAEPLPTIDGKGIDGEHPLGIEVIGDVAAVFSEIDPRDFSGPASREKMEDLGWVAARALRHEEVVLSAMKHGPVLPVRFGTIFSSLAAAAEPLRQRREVLAKYFRDTASKQEWTLKGYVDRPRARAKMTATRLAAEKEQLAGLSPGKRYFLEQKIKGTVDRDMAIWLKEMAREILGVVREVSAGFSECRLQSQDVTGRDEEMFFHGALLVADGTAKDLPGITNGWNSCQKEQGLRIELSGPWPPYHFAPAF